MPFILIILLLLCSASAYTHAETSHRKVQITDAYIELHTGPGRGYPVFHVVDRSEWIEIRTRKTDWFKVVASNGTTGWAHQNQLEQTLNPQGQQTHFEQIDQHQFNQRKTEAGVLSGDMDGAQTITLYAAYKFTQNLSTELSLMQAIGNYSNNLVTNINLLNQPFPDWRISPYFALGMGNIKTTPRATLVLAKDRSDLLAHVGIGAYAYVSSRFALRAEYNRYVVFSNNDDNEDIKEWKIGLVTFF